MTGTVEGNAPLERFEALIAEQGKKKSWVARHAGLTVEGLGKRFRRKKWYPWKPGEQEAVAKALGVPVTVIWEDYKNETAGS